MSGMAELHWLGVVALVCVLCAFAGCAAVTLFYWARERLSRRRR